METTKKSKFHYGFVIVLGGFIIMALLHSMLQTCFSLFLVPVTEGMGVTRTQFSLKWVNCLARKIRVLFLRYALPAWVCLMQHIHLLQKSGICT